MGTNGPDEIDNSTYGANTTLIKIGTNKVTLVGNNPPFNGVTVISNGVLEVGDGGTVGRIGSGNVTNFGALVWNKSTNETYSMLISGTGRLRKTGTGTLTITNANTYTGPTVIHKGTLVFTPIFYPLTNLATAYRPLQGTITVQADGVLSFGNINFYNQLGANANGFTNPITPVVVEGGTIDSSGTVTTFTNLVMNGGTLRGSGGFGDPWGAFVLLGTVNVTADSAFLSVSGSDNALTPGAWVGNHTVTFQVTNGATLTNGLPIEDYNSSANKYSVTKTGGGTLILNANNTYTGPTAVNGGTLRLGPMGRISGSAVTVNSGGRVEGSGILSSLTLASGGTLGILAAATNTNAVWNTAGTIVFSNGAQVDVTGLSLTNANFPYFLVRGTNVTGTPALVGTTAFTVTNSNNTTLLLLPTLDTDGDGLTDYRESQLGTNPNLADTDGDGLSDGTEVAAGTDPINTWNLLGGTSAPDPTNSVTLSSSLTVRLGLPVDYLIVGGGGGGGGYIGGGGGAGGVLTNAGGIPLILTNSIYTNTVGAGGAGGSNNNRGSDGSSSSAFGLTALGGGAGGAYNSINGDAALQQSGNSGASGGGGAPYNNGSLIGSGGTATQGNAGGSGQNFSSFRGGGGGGAGSAGTSAGSSTFGNGGNGLASSITGVNVTYGGGGGGGVNVGSSVGTGGAGGGGNGGVGSGSSANGVAGTANTGGGGGGGGYAQPSTSTGGSGGSGVVMVRYPGASVASGGAVSSINLGGTYYTLHRFTNTGSSTFQITNLAAKVLGTISGTGGVQVASPGTVTLASANTYSGSSVIESGATLQVGDGGTSGTVGAGNVTNNGTLVFNRSDTNTFTNLISGPGDVWQVGSGTTILTAANTYSGGTLITNGILQIGGTNGALGTGNVLVTNNGTLSILRSNSYTFTNRVAGPGAFRKDGTNTVTVTGSNSYSGGTLISGGTLLLGNNGTTGLLGTGPVTNQGTLVLNRSDALILSNLISGTGGVTKSNANTVTLTAANSFSGPYRHQAGFTILSNAVGPALFAGTNGTLVIGNNGSGGTYSAVKLGRTNQLGPNVDVLFDVANTWAYLTLLGRNLEIGNLLSTTNNPQWAVIELTENESDAGNGTLTVTQTTNSTFQGYIRNKGAGSGGILSLEKNGPATLALSGANIIYTGSTTVNEGALVLSNTTAYAATNHVLGSNGILEIHAPSGATLDQGTTKFTGNGIFRKTGPGTLRWGGTAAEFAMSGGRIEVSQGTLVGSSSANEVWTNNRASLFVAAGATFQGVEGSIVVDALEGDGTITTGFGSYNPFVRCGVNNGSGTFAGSIANNGSNPGRLFKAGTGTQVLSGTNTHTGATVVEAGVLTIATSGKIVSSAVTVTNGATLQVDGAAGAVSVLANGTVQGTGTITNLVVNSNGVANILAVSTNTTGAWNTGGSVTFSNGAQVRVSNLTNLPSRAYYLVKGTSLTGTPSLAGPGAGSYEVVVTNQTVVLFPNANSDADSLTDYRESLLGTDPTNPDTDGDGLNDDTEANTYGTSPLLADTDGDGVTDKEEVDYGTSPIVATIFNRLVNGSFEDGSVKPPTGSWTNVPQANVPGWKTTATNGLIELWYTGFQGTSGADGNTLAELNANQVGTLYQDVVVTTNCPVNYAFLHRGRSGTDVMDFKIDLLVGGPGTAVATNVFSNRVSTGTSWVRYSGQGVVTVQKGKTYRFSFVSVSSSSGSATEGNLVDATLMETDQDSDGLSDSVETKSGNFVSAANTGTDPNLADTDGDGVNDGLEVAAGTNPNDPASHPKPRITAAPLAATKAFGQTNTFSVVVATNYGPFGYQWRKDGINRSGATNPSLTLQPLQMSDAGDYDVVVTNSYGAVTSSVANLVVNKAVPTVTVSLGTYTFNGSAQGPVPSNVVTGLSTGAVSMTYAGRGSTSYGPSSNRPTNAGTYNVTATVAADANHETASSGAVPFTIGASTLPPSAAWTSPANLTFDGTSKGYTATVSGVSGFVYSYAGRNGTVYGPSSNAPSAAGDYTVTATSTDPSYTGSVSNNFTIAKLPLAVTAQNTNRPYGSPNPTFAAVFSGFTNGDGTHVISGAPGFSTTANPTSAPGTYPILVSTGSLSASNYSFNLSNGILTVNKKAASVTLTNLNTVYSTNLTLPTAVTVPAGLAVNLTYNGTTNEPSSAGSYQVVGTIDDANHEGSVTNTFVVAAAPQTVTFDPLNSTYPIKGLANLPVSAKASSGLPVTLSLDTNSVATLSGVLTNGSGDLNNVGYIGKVYLRARQGGDANYLPAADATFVIDVEKNNQSISFTNLPTQVRTNAPFQIFATATSGNPVSFSVLSGPAYLTNNSPTALVDDMVTITGLGKVVIRASRAEDPSNNAAPDVDQEFEVTKASQSVTSFSLLVYPKYGDSVDLTGKAVLDSGLAPVYEVVSGPGVLSNNILRLTGAGDVVIRASHPGNDTFTPAAPVNETLTVAKKAITVTAVDTSREFGTANPAFTVAYSSDFVAGDTAAVLDAPPAVTTTVSPADVPGIYTNVLTPGGAADENYSFTTVSGTLTVTAASQTIGFAALPAKTYGDPAFDLNATASSGLAVSYTSSDTNVATLSGNTVTIVGVGSTDITATQAGDGNYAAATPVTNTLVVNPELLPPLVWTAPASLTYDGNGKVYSASAHGVSGFSYLYQGTNGTTYGASAAAPTNVGSYTVKATSADPNFSGSESRAFSVLQATPVITQPPTATSIRFGQALSNSVLTNGLASTAGSFGFATPSALPGVGTSNQTVLFTPTDTTNFTAASTTVSLTVGKADATISLTGTHPTYDGTAKGVSVTTSPTNLPVVVSYNGSTNAPTNAGSYAVVASVNDPNYSGSTNGTLTIAKATPSIGLVSADTRAFGTADYLLAVTSGPASSPLTFSSDNPAVATVSPVGMVSLVAAGSTTIRVNQSGDANHEAAPEVTQALTVTKPAAAVALADLTQTYNGTALGVTVTTTPAGVATEVFYGNPPTTNAPTNAGSYPVAVNVTDPNYSGGTNGTLTITKATPTIQRLPDASAITYGQEFGNSVLTNGAAVLGTNPVTGTFDFANRVVRPGAGIISAGVTFTPTETNNYHPVALNVSLTVLPAPAMIVVTGTNLTYDGTAKSVTVTTSPTNLPVEVTYDSLTNLPIQAGNYQVVATVTDANHAGSETNTLTIAQAPLTVAAVSTSRLYGAANPPLALSYAGFVNGENQSVLDVAPTVSLSNTVTLTSPPGVYSNVLVPAGGNDNNYRFSSYLSGDLTIVDGDLDSDGVGDFAEISAGTDPADPSDRPMQLASGASHTLYIPTIGGRVLAWGANQVGQCGLGSFSNPVVSGVPVQGASGSVFTGAVAVAVGAQHSLILRNDGRVFAAGTNGFGQLGLGTNVPVTNRFTEIAGLTNVRAIVSGDDFAVARDGNGRIWTWGYNLFGQLGNGSLANQSQPRALTNSGPFSLVAAGTHHVAALDTNGLLHTWGRGNYGQLGLGSVLRTNVPTPVNLGTLLGTNRVIQIGAGLSQTFFLTTAGEVWAFGRNELGQLGLGTNVISTNLPTRISNAVAANGIVRPLPEIRRISVGPRRVLAIARNGQVYGWGYNRYGELGLPPSTNAPLYSEFLPTEVPALYGAKEIAGGGFQTFSLDASGTLVASGFNEGGQLGVGSTNPVIGAPAPTTEAGKSNQTISFASNNVTGMLRVGGGAALTGSASSGLPLVYTVSDTNLATVVGTNVTFRAAGTLAITARQPGDTNYNAAASVTVSNLVIAKAKPVLTWNPPPVALAGSALSDLHLNATANVPGFFLYTPPLGTVLVPGTTTLLATFLPEDAANVEEETVSVSLEVVAPIPLTLTMTASNGLHSFSESTAVDPGLEIQNNTGEEITDARIRIEEGFSPGDRLELPPGSGYAGISSSYDPARGMLYLSGTGSRESWQAALRAVRFSTTSTSAADRLIRMALGRGIPYGGHVYEFNPWPSGFNNARSAALAKILHGEKGYLANVTSAGENAFLLSMITTDSWLGAADAAAEGQWRWLDGPEKGTNFWNGNSGGSAPEGQYVNWIAGEPNDDGGLEDAIQIKTGSGGWNDENKDAGHVVEYGSSATQPVTFTGARRIRMAVSSQTITFSALPTKVVGNPEFLLTATTTSGLPVSYTSSNPGVATVTSNRVTIVGPGTTTITASQAGGMNWSPAIPVARTLFVSPQVVSGNSRYVLVDGPTWTQAEAAAVALGGHLASIGSLEENNLLTSAFRNLSTEDYAFWIGGTDEGTEGNWRWVDGSPWTYTRWYPGEPNNTFNADGSNRAENYASLVVIAIGSGEGSIPGGWNDMPNDSVVAAGWPRTVRGIAEIPIPDTNAPVITLTGPNPLQIYKGASFNDPGATVTDNRDASRSIFGAGAVNVMAVGSYYLSYTAVDAAGNMAVPVMRTVNVVLDPAADEDGDGLNNGSEISGGTNPYQKDSDGDGVNDPLEIADGTNPANASSYKSLSQGLMAYYPLDGNTKDISGNGRDGVLEGAMVATDRFGSLKGAFSFGDINRIVVPHDSSLGPKQGTVVFWVFGNSWTNSDGSLALVSKDTPTENRQWTLQVFPDGQLRTAVFTENGEKAGDSTVRLSAGVWNQIAMRWDGASLVAYLNGAEVISIPAEGNLISGTSPVFIGGNPGFGTSLDGSIDEVRIYNRALSAAEVGQLYVADSPAGRNLLVNGGFENSVNNKDLTTRTFDPAVDGWSGTGNFSTYRLADLDISTPAELGQRQLALNGANKPVNAWIEQTVPAQAGKTYRLSFQSSRIGTKTGGVIRSVVLDGVRNILTSTQVIKDGSLYEWASTTQFVTAVDTVLIVRFEDASTNSDEADPLLDAVELVELVAGDSTDSDGDGLTDFQETRATLSTNPLLADSDGDGANDKVEVDLGFNPKNPGSNPKPVILEHPMDAVGTAGGSASFTVTAANPAGVAGMPMYQWTKGGSPLAGKTNSMLQLPSLGSGDAGTYAVTVSNPYGSVTSSPAVLTVNPAVPTLIAGWDFQTTTSGGTATAPFPSTPKIYNANFGSGNLFLDGSFSSGNWLVGTSPMDRELDSTNGTSVNLASSFSANTTSPAGALALLAGKNIGTALPIYAANGKSMSFSFSMSGRIDLQVSYATAATPGGFTKQRWEYSTNGVNWNFIADIVPPTAAFSPVTLPVISALNNSATPYLRVTFDGATALSGANRIDNIQFWATPASSPGSSPGAWSFDTGDYRLESADPVLLLELGGLTGTTLYDQIFVRSGAATLDGIVNLMFYGSYTGPVSGSWHTFDLIWAQNGIVLGDNYQLVFNQPGFTVDTAVVQKDGGELWQATVRQTVTPAQAAALAQPALGLAQSPGPAGSVEMLYTYTRPTGGSYLNGQYVVGGVRYELQISSDLKVWSPAALTEVSAIPVGVGRENVTVKVMGNGPRTFLRLKISN